MEAQEYAEGAQRFNDEAVASKQAMSALDSPAMPSGIDTTPRAC